MFEQIHANHVYRCLVNGQWKETSAHSPIEIFGPADHTQVGFIQSFSKDDVDEAFQAAKAAQKKWAETPISVRAQILHRCADLMEEYEDEIAAILSVEISKDIASAKSEVHRTADFIHFTADEGKHIEGEMVGADHFPGFNKRRFSIVTRVPLGVVLAISPFNYPVNLSASKVAPALMAGNSVVLKPPTSGSISALYMSEIFRAGGIPDGVLNTVTGLGSEIGDYLVKHPLVDFVSFTGSTSVGKHIAKQVGMIPLLMELGGKDAAIVLEDADLDETARDIVSGAYSYSGQRCTAVKRVLVIDSVADELIAKLKEKVEALKVGMPHEDVQVTPLINTKAADFVQELIDDALTKGAELLCGNKREGNLIYPTLFDKVTTDMRLAWEEPFGPVLPVIRIKNAEEGIDIANRSEYGLQSSVFTKNIDSAFNIANQLDVGTVHLNNKTERGPDHFPFLGVKSSGMGTQGIRYSIEAMSRPKVIVVNLEK
ncbi:NADP-dependent glyceraldehyde-3-phosphate dehydrogenase [Scatolibacter rhodanostii]|uniref:NADP-dependent glyceraldehyde-3-phosphate dehydrogenase n=1 Tax=Scatolibacter rhodanostii TaxID=2014781 RepID=UPI000C068FB9|nr:NADP-dependent glyceraldehyde-3-phosphate dehydrogenase [Scatolibacter rhodanostii]